MNIKVRDLLGDNYSIEDAILLREIIRNNLDQGVILDFMDMIEYHQHF